ncbi:choline kinase A2-like [Oppia nitens]|uniref:choline kinase A2-like n=1 Tax=Oppia nitens TaxID=1686743 RepID=UPI0023DBCA50|nr:choline kinase A2-like [Oppia nitens]
MSDNNSDINDTNNESNKPTLHLERGRNVDNYKEKCHQLCQQYLGGVWLDTTVEDMKIRRLSGGLTNQIYYCGIDEKLSTTGDGVPHEVVVLYYQDKHFKENERLSDTVISVMMSDNNLGPKLCGVFPGGQIQKFYKNKNFRVDQQNNPKLVNKLAKQLARVHALDVPINRSTDWMFDYFYGCYQKASQRFDLPALIDECQCETLKLYDIKQELDWLKDVITNSNIPVVFTHVDFRGSNIMITEDEDIVVCDFEYCGYGYRGYDFGTIFVEWGKDFEVLGYDYGKFIGQVSNNTNFRPFIESYFNEMVAIYGDKFAADPRNSVDAMLREAKLFSLIAYMFIIIYSLQLTESIVNGITTYDKKHEMKEGTDKLYKIYHEVKSKYLEDNVFQF